MFATILTLAMRSILRHKLRSFLTTLGIIIGVAAVVTMVTLGQATTASVQKSIANLGTNILQVRPGQGFGRGGGSARPADFKPGDLHAKPDQVAGGSAGAAQAQASGAAIHDGANWSTTITGTTNGYFDVQPWALAEGRYFTPAEEAAGRSVCILGATVNKNVFRSETPVGSRMRIGNVSCEVIGLLSARGQGGFGDQDDVVIMPLKTVQRRFTGSTDLKLILVGVDKAYSTASVQASIEDLLRERRNIANGKDDDFFILDTKQISDTFTGVTKLLTSIVTAVAAISLVVGGIGIMNIMLVSVTERTREIGIRLAIGALAGEVLMQFLVEAVALSCLGGLMGLLLAQAAVAALAPLMKVSWIFVPQINLIAFGVSGLIGVLFGYVPARRAAALNPIDALRHE
jgi:putative ABC transport system permease protein